MAFTTAITLLQYQAAMMTRWNNAIMQQEFIRNPEFRLMQRQTL